MIFVYLQSCYLLLYGRFIGFMVSVRESGSRGLGSRPGRVIVLCSWAKHFTPTMPLSSNWREAWRNTWGGRGVTLPWTGIPPRGGESSNHAKETEISSSFWGGGGGRRSNLRYFLILMFFSVLSGCSRVGWSKEPKIWSFLRRLEISAWIVPEEIFAQYGSL